MDPNVLLNRINDGLYALNFGFDDADREETVEDLRNLASWLEKGGYAPGPVES